MIAGTDLWFKTTSDGFKGGKKAGYPLVVDIFKVNV